MKDLILVIDDDVGILRAFEKILTKENFLISTSSHPEEALALISAKKPQVVIVDMKMPGVSGIDLLRQIKKTYPKLPVVVMTAYSNIFTEKEVLKLGADYYFKKPFEINTMLEKIKQLTTC